MNHISAIAVLGASLLASACTSANPGHEIVPEPGRQMRVLSETKSKGPSDTLNEAERAAVERARDTLATRLSIDGARVSLVSVQNVEWSDSSLGCPKPRQSYLQVVTPGYRVVLKQEKQTYHVHVAKGAVVICQNVEAGPFLRSSQAISARALDRMQQQARQDLAKQFNAPVEEVELGMSIPSRWPDASLGCPAAGVTYPPVVTNGFRIILTLRGRTVFYHTDGQRVFPCPAIELE